MREIEACAVCFVVHAMNYQNCKIAAEIMVGYLAILLSKWFLEPQNAVPIDSPVLAEGKGRGCWHRKLCSIDDNLCLNTTALKSHIVILLGL
jgi:hypothetical protein